MEYKLSYFGTRGRGEVIRMVFAAAGVKFEDERIAREQWPDVKPSKLLIFAYMYTHT